MFAMRAASRSGQVMILTILALGGTLLGATTVAGLLTLYQIRNSTDLENSAKAIFAADAGVEWGLYKFSCNPANGGIRLPCAVPEPVAEIDFSNGSSVKVTCLNSSGEVDCTDSSVTSIKSVGASGGSSRAFEVFF